MKVVIPFSVICISLFLGCKKKEDVPTAPAVKPTVENFTAKVNNKDWYMFRSSLSANRFDNYFYFGGASMLDNPVSGILINKVPGVTGIVPLGVLGGAYAMYNDGSGHLFTSRTGTLNITVLDTFPPYPSKYLKNIKSTFSFKTDTFNNISYDITNGVMEITN